MFATCFHRHPSAARHPLTLLVCLPFVLGLSACSEDDPATPEPVVPLIASDNVGAGGGTFQSGDGRLTVIVPPGALADDTDLSVTEVDPAELDDIHEGLDPVATFRLEPADLQLAQPVTITFVQDLTSLPTKSGDAIKSDDATKSDDANKTGEAIRQWGADKLQNTIRRPLAIAMVTHETIDQQPVHTLEDVSQVVSFIDGTVATTVNVRGFGRHLDVGRALKLVGDVRDPVWYEVSYDDIASAVEHTQLALRIEQSLGPGVYIDGAMIYHEYEASGLTTSFDDGAEVTPVSEGTGQDGEARYSLTMSCDLGAAGLARLKMGLSQDLHLDQSIWPETLRFGADPTFHLEHRFPSLQITVQPDQTGPGEALDSGLYEIDTGLEGVSLIANLQGWKYDGSVVTSGSNGSNFRSLSRDNALATIYTGFSQPGNLRYGGFVSYTQPRDKVAPTGTVFFGFGPLGASITAWLPEDNDWGWTQLVALQSIVTDAQPYVEGPGSGGLVYVNFSLGQVRFLEYDAGSGFWDVAGTLGNFPGSVSGPVTAAARTGGGALIVTNGTPGRIYVHDRQDMGAAATYVGDAGDSPRRLRVAGELAVVSNFGTSDLTVVTWTAQDVATVVGTVDVGAGPVGIDLLELAGGNVAVVSTGFDDDTYTITVLSAAGAVISNTTHDLPAGATGPGHAIWLHDEARRIMVTCNTSGHILVTESGL